MTESPGNGAPHKGNEATSKAGPKPSGIKAPGPKWQVSQFKVPEAEGKCRFHSLGLPTPVMHAISDLGFSYCTPIQAEILPKALSGSDVTGKAQTGTGKSAAFLIPAKGVGLVKVVGGYNFKSGGMLGGCYN